MPRLLSTGRHYGNVPDPRGEGQRKHSLKTFYRSPQFGPPLPTSQTAASGGLGWLQVRARVSAASRAFVTSATTATTTPPRGNSRRCNLGWFCPEKPLPKQYLPPPLQNSRVPPSPKCLRNQHLLACALCASSPYAQWLWWLSRWVLEHRSTSLCTYPQSELLSGRA